MAAIATPHIESTPDICGGKPRIAGTRIKVSLIAILSETNRMPPDDIVEAYPHLTLAQVHAALTFYWDHRDQIEQEIREDDQFVASLQAKLGSNDFSIPLGKPADGNSLSSG